TGDLSVAPHAPVVVATLEAAQGALLRRPTPAPAPDHAGPEGSATAPAPGGGDVGSPPDLLVVDEYQWLGDPARGNHYEGVLATLPASVQLLLLSGSVANPEDVAAWLTRLGRRVEVVRTAERPVPLEEVEIDDLVQGLPREIEGFWSRRVAAALREGLAPVLVFAPHRADAERLA